MTTVCESRPLTLEDALRALLTALTEVDVVTIAGGLRTLNARREAEAAETAEMARRMSDGPAPWRAIARGNPHAL